MKEHTVRARTAPVRFGKFFMKKKYLYHRLMLSIGLFVVFPAFGFFAVDREAFA